MQDNLERRRFTRYKVKDNAVAFLGKSACSILDVSAVGISVRYSLIEQEAANPAHLDIFLEDTKFYLPKVPVEVVDEVMTSPHSMFSSLRIKRLGLKFKELSPEQQKRLDEFITYHMKLAC